MVTILNKVLLLLSSITYCILDESNIRILPYRPGNEPFQIIGIFSNCNDKDQDNSSQFRMNANACRYHARNIAQQKNKIADYIEEYHVTRPDLFGFWDYLFKKRRKWSLDDVEYIDFEVCSSKDAAQVAMDIALDKKYFVTNETSSPPKFDGLDIDNWWRIKVLTVVLFTGSYIIV